MQALKEQLEGTQPLIIGDLDSNLDVPQTTQKKVLSAEMAERGISCVAKTLLYVAEKATPW